MFANEIELEGAVYRMESLFLQVSRSLRSLLLSFPPLLHASRFPPTQKSMAVINITIYLLGELAATIDPCENTP